ncbi:MAG: PEGA domain-containing protein [Alistipes sp.]|nr:PEGA domain-containing protein [Alistipes sp.]
MKRFFSILTLLFVALSASAQMEHSIVLDRSSFRAVQTDALTGVNIDPIGEDSSREPCARLKIKFDRMNKAQIDALEVKMRSNTDLTKQKVADYYDNVLILEMTAKPNTRFYFVSPEFGESNEVTLNLEGNREYEMLASLNQTYSIVVNSNVANADVYIDGVFKGKTDSSNSLTVKDVLIGGHTLKVVYGSVSNQKNIDVNSGSISFRVNVDTAANEPQFVVFTVEPAVALVLIDNKPYTVTDGAMQVVLESGTYNYTVTAEGYHPKSGTFTVAGEKVVNQVSLTADALSVTLNAPNGAEIWVNGEKKGVSRWSGILNSGTYIFEARKAGHKSASLTKTISSQVPMQSFTLPAPTPITGSIVVSGTPIMADVALDGKVVGQTPVKLGNILVGEHTITISKDGYKTNTQTITVAEGKSTTVNVALTKLNAQSSNTTTAATPTYPYITAKESIIIDTQNINSIVDSDNHMGIGHDMAYRPCARVKILFDMMSADEIKKLKIRCASNTQMITKAFVEPNQNVLIFEITAKLNTNIYLQHPSWGNSNTVTIDLQPYGEYTLMARRNISTIAPSQSVSSTPATPATPATTKTYKVGDIITINGVKGIIFQTSPMVKIVSVEETTAAWSTDYGNTTHICNISNGKENLKKIKAISGWQTKYPAFKWCADLGDGWYLPSIKELQAIYTQSEKINNTLSTNNMGKLGSKNSSLWLWSSCEGTSSEACYVDLSFGTDSRAYKSCGFAVRAVRVVTGEDIPALAVNKTYKVGDYYNQNGKEGVVFEVTADGKHGKIVSMTQSDRGIRWASDVYEQKRLIGADSKSDGAYNMAKVKSISGWQTKYPVFKWCADLGDGWYLPAIDELEKFMLDKSVWIAVSRTLIASGGTALHNVAASTVNIYWSSTEYAYQLEGIFYAWNIYMKDGTVAKLTKSSGGEYSYTFVRAVAKF